MRAIRNIDSVLSLNRAGPYSRVRAVTTKLFDLIFSIHWQLVTHKQMPHAMRITLPCTSGNHYDGRPHSGNHAVKRVYFCADMSLPSSLVNLVSSFSNLALRASSAVFCSATIRVFSSIAFCCSFIASTSTGTSLSYESDL